jgi:LETM1 and EF-hand domain-containing protein 1
MVPATCKKDEKQRRILRVRLEMAKFLQETLRESGIKGGKSIVGTDEFKAFFYKVRYTDSVVSAPCVSSAASPPIELNSNRH